MCKFKWPLPRLSCVFIKKVIEFNDEKKRVGCDSLKNNNNKNKIKYFIFSSQGQ